MQARFDEAAAFGLLSGLAGFPGGPAGTDAVRQPVLPPLGMLRDAPPVLLIGEGAGAMPQTLELHAGGGEPSPALRHMVRARILDRGATDSPPVDREGTTYFVAAVPGASGAPAGALGLERAAPWTAGETAFVRAAAAAIGNGMQGARLLRESGEAQARLRSQNEELLTLRELMAALQGHGDEPALLDAALEIILRRMHL